MTFEHVKTETQGGVIDNILLLDDQASNHRRTPEEIIAFNEERLEQLKEHRSDRAYHAALERIELARGASIFRQLKRDLGAIDFGDQISLALKVVEEHPQVAAEYRQRFGAVLLDEYQDTDVAQAKLIAGVFGGGHPVTAVGDPDQNIYAWRGASLFNLLDFPQQFPRADGSPSTQLPLYTNFRSGAWILEAADVVISKLPEQQRPGPRQAAGALDRERDGGGARRADLRRVEGSGVDRRAHPRAARRRRQVVGRRRALPIEPVVLLAAASVRRTRDPGGDPGARGTAAPARDRRGARVRARRERSARERGAREDPARPPVPRRLQGPGARGGAREDEELRAPPGGRGGGRGHAVPVRRGARASRPGGTTVGRRADAARGVPARAGGPARRGPQARRRVPGRDRPAHRASWRSWTRTRTRSRRPPPSATSRRSWTRCTRSSRSKGS